MGTYDDDDDDDDDDVNCDDEEDEVASAQLLERYTRSHGLRRHTIGRPDLMVHGGPIPNLASRVQFAHQNSSIQPSFLANRLADLQQLQQQKQQQFNLSSISDSADECCTQSSRSIHDSKDTHSASFNGLSTHTPMIHATSDAHNQQYLDRNWLSPLGANTFRTLLSNKKSYISCSRFFQIDMNRRASDSGAHLLLLQQQYGALNSNALNAALPTQLPSPLSTVRSLKTRVYLKEKLLDSL